MVQKVGNTAQETQAFAFAAPRVREHNGLGVPSRSSWDVLRTSGSATHLRRAFAAVASVRLYAISERKEDATIIRAHAGLTSVLFGNCCPNR